MNKLEKLLFGICFLLPFATFPVLAACSFLQQQQPAIQCAALASVENAADLATFVDACKGVTDTYSAYTDCVKPAVGSRWSQDVVNCFSKASLQVATCPAYSTARAQPAQLPDHVGRVPPL